MRAVPFFSKFLRELGVGRNVAGSCRRVPHKGVPAKMGTRVLVWGNPSRGRLRAGVVLLVTTMTVACAPVGSEPEAPAAQKRAPATSPTPKFHLMEARIADIQSAIQGERLTSTALVKLYLKRIQAYNGRCVKQPDGLLGRIETIPNAGQINALSTLNLRPATREIWGFDERKARSMTVGDMPQPRPARGVSRPRSSLTFVGSMLQWPALSVPSGYLGEALPVGLQILGRAWDEQKIVRYGYAYEQATRYRHSPPATPPLATAFVKRFIGTWKLIALGAWWE